MHIELLSQVFFCTNSVAREGWWREELALALNTRRQHRNFTLVTKDDEAAIIVPGRNADRRTARVSLEQLRDCAEPCSVLEGEAQLAISTLEEAAHGGNYDADVMRRRRRRSGG